MRLPAYLILLFMFGAACAQAPPPQAPSERGRVWALWREINKQALGAKLGVPVPVWRVWCDESEAIQDAQDPNKRSRCVEEFIYAKGLNLRESGQVPPESATSPEKDLRRSVHLNPELVARLFEYQGEADDQEERWLLKSSLKKKYADEAKATHPLFPFGEEPGRPYRWPRTVKNRVAIAVKAVWFVYNRATVCADPSKGTMPVFAPEDAPSDKSIPWGWKLWKQERVINMSAVCGTSYPLNKLPSGSVSLSQFDFFEVAAAVGSVPKGSVAVLAGLHLATRETKEWVWSTFYWHPDANHAEKDWSKYLRELRGPWANYAMKTSSNQTDIVFNPYIEGDMKNGLQSNCMSCHRLAALGRSPHVEHCMTSDPIPENAPAFIKYKSVLTDYLWTVAARTNGAQPWDCKEFAPTPKP